MGIEQSFACSIDLPKQSLLKKSDICIAQYKEKYLKNYIQANISQQESFFKESSLFIFIFY